LGPETGRREGAKVFLGDHGRTNAVVGKAIQESQRAERRLGNAVLVSRGVEAPTQQNNPFAPSRLPVL
jgi:hypothetical protein